MIEWISEWVKNIVFVILLASFVDLLLPNSNMQKYARIVLGMLIILIIIAPILGIFEKSFSINDLSKELDKLNSNNTMFVLESIDSIKEQGQLDYQAKMINQIENDMEKNLKDLLEKELDILVLELILDAKIKNNIWEIDRIVVYAMVKGDDDIDDKTPIGIVEEVRIEEIVLDDKNTSSNMNEDNDELKQKINNIKEIIQKEWDIEKEKIVVYLESDLK